MNCDFVLKVLRIINEREPQEDIWWRTDGKYAPVTFFVDCNDLFHWAVADAEPLTEENVDELERAIQDAGEEDGPLLFCCRMRKMRPQGAYYNYIKPKNFDLFDECGPEREVDFSNPKNQKGEYKYTNENK